MKSVLVCVTGASGAIYGERAVAALVRAGVEVRAVASAWGSRVFAEERGLDFADRCRELGVKEVHDPADLAASVASGSCRLSGTLIAPCSMSTLAALATGNVRNLVHRAGAVALKEGWPLVVMPRESPLSLVDLRNLVALAEAGAAVLPACPGFYHKPATIEELVDQAVGKALDRLGVEHDLFKRWE